MSPSQQVNAWLQAPLWLSLLTFLVALSQPRLYSCYSASSQDQTLTALCSSQLLSPWLGLSFLVKTRCSISYVHVKFQLLRYVEGNLSKGIKRQSQSCHFVPWRSFPFISGLKGWEVFAFNAVVFNVCNYYSR